MKIVNTICVGTGGYGGMMLQELFDGAKSDLINLIGVVDPYAEKSPIYNNIIKAKNIPVYENISTAFDRVEKSGIKINFVYIATPIQFHTEQIKYSLMRGANVLCEKPMTGNVKDLPVLEKFSSTNNFVGIGFQWSFSSAIQRLKKDVMSGVLGRPEKLKTIVLWPRKTEYFNKTGWKGKMFTVNGEKISDSIVNNAAAHYIHNMLYILGDCIDSAMGATDIKATLLRANDIETFDSAVVKFKFECGADGLFVGSHTTDKTIEPKFEYVFEKATVSYNFENGNIIAEFKDGVKKNYGDPFGGGATRKINLCAELTANGSVDVLCGIKAAKEHVLFVDKLHSANKIYNVKQNLSHLQDGVLVVNGLTEALLECYDKGTIISDLAEFY